jgi:hypothetical protein
LQFHARFEQVESSASLYSEHGAPHRRHIGYNLELNEDLTDHAHWDVHFPDAHKEIQADIKDLAFPSVVTNAMLVHPLQSVVRAATIELKRTTIHGIVFPGT